MAVKRINHVALVVPDIEEATAFYRDVLGLRLERVERIYEQEVTVAFFPVGNSKVELLQPTTDTSGVARFLEKRGPGMHHLCLEVDDIEETLEALRARGVELIDEQPRETADGKKMAFIHPRSTYGVLIELYELPASHPVARLQQVAPVQTLGRQLAIELRALRAGASAFWRALRTPTPSAPVSKANGNGNGSTPIGITLKAEGEMLEE
ncbi:MAG: methylmalonyl-CoA epimerase [Chloroflexi bacterium]|nr:methylmalonyl-CoA epimerase [Chloroflexota bacterium]